jgi:hypothetical protein
MLSKKPIPLQVTLHILLRLWVCGAAMIVFPSFFLHSLDLMSWDEPSDLVASIAGGAFLAYIFYRLLKDIWEGGITGVIFVALMAVLLPALVALSELFLGGDPLAVYSDWLPIMVMTLLGVAPLVVRVLLRRWEERDGPVHTTMENYARVAVRICLVYIFLVALLKLPGVTSLEHWSEGLQVLLYVVVPLLALRTWRCHRPSAWLLFGSGVILLVIEAAIFSDVADSGQFTRKLFYSLVIFHLPRLAPAVLLWWVGRRGCEEAAEAEPLDVSDSGNARESC